MPVDSVKNESQTEGPNLKSIRAAFASTWAIAGAIAASVAAFNLVRNVFSINLSSVLTEVAHAYQGLIHVPIGWLVTALHWPSPTPWIIDVVVVWLLLGGIVARSIWQLRKSAMSHHWFFPIADVVEGKIKLLGSRTEGFLWRVMLQKPWAAPMLFIGSTVFWPSVVFSFFRWPQVHFFAGTPADSSITMFARRWRSTPNAWPAVRFLYDMRIVLGVQGLIVVTAVACWFGLNALLRLYGE